MSPALAEIYHTTFDWPPGTEVQNRLVAPAGISELETAQRLLGYHRDIVRVLPSYPKVLKVISADQPCVDVFYQGELGGLTCTRPSSSHSHLPWQHPASLRVGSLGAPHSEPLGCPWAFCVAGKSDREGRGEEGRGPRWGSREGNSIKTENSNKTPPPPRRPKSRSATGVSRAASRPPAWAGVCAAGTVGLNRPAPTASVRTPPRAPRAVGGRPPHPAEPRCCQP